MLKSGLWNVVGVMSLSLACGCSEPNVSNPPVKTAPPGLAPTPAISELDPTTFEIPGETDADAPQEFTKTDSGLGYRILRASDGRRPSAAETVRVHYKGQLANGTVFDSSYDRGEPIEFPLSGVIPGWTEGLQLIGEGGMLQLQIPSNLGYGSFGSPPTIPGNATLYFFVELLEVK